jgi:hypothetical protein
MLGARQKQAIALGLALFGIAGVVLWLGSLPISSCEPPKPRSEAEKHGNNLKKDCPTIFGTGITNVGRFIHDNRDEITAASTAIIAIFTVVLGVFTIRLAKATRIAAEAAKLSAQAAINVELPRLFAAKIDFELAAINLVDPEASLQKISVTITNYGRTPAFLYCESAEFFYGPLPESPIYPNAIDLEPGTIIEKGQLRTLNCLWP